MISELIDAFDKTDIKAKTTIITKLFDKESLRFVHRSMMDDEPSNRRSGILRSVGVWIVAPGSSPEHARYIPPISTAFLLFASPVKYHET